MTTSGTISTTRYRVESTGARYFVSTVRRFTRVVTVGNPGRMVTVYQRPTYRVTVNPTAARIVTVGVQGPRGAPGGEGAAGYEAENVGLAVLAAGVPVAIGPAGTGFVGAAAADGSKPAVGLLTEAVQPGFAGTIQTAGVLDLPDWTAATGAATLSPRAPYFLDVAAARITTVPPTGAGQIVQYLGRAVSLSSIAIQPHNFIRKG